MKAVLSVILTLSVLFFHSSAQTDVCQADGTCKIGDEVQAPKGANSQGKPREAVKECFDRHEQCVDFAKNGECDKAPG